MRKVLGVLMGVAVLVGMAGPASAQTGTNQRFTLVQRLTSGGGGQPGTVVATGPIHGRGSFVSPEGESETAVIPLTFAGGTIDVLATDTTTSDQFDPRSCVARFTFGGVYELIDGTGAYAGATGSGTYQARGTFVAGRNPDGSCSETSGSGVLIVNVVGHTTLGGSAAA